MRETLKILITAPSLDERENVSGISTVVRQIIENGNHCYTHFGAGKKDGERQNAAWFLKQTALPFRFFQIVKREKINLVHINTALNPLSIIRDFALVKAAEFAKVPILLHIHGGKYLAREFENDSLKNIAEKMLRAADRILVLSELEKRITEIRLNGLEVEFLENAVGTENFADAEKRENSIIYLGRLHESKGLNETVEAVRVLKNENVDFTFRAFGAGEAQNFFVAEMTKILGEKFYFGGVIAGKAKREELARSSIFVLASRYGEGLPMALLEAMAARCVVVASEMASVGAVVRDGYNGFTVEPGNAAQLTETLRKILTTKNDFKSLRENARETVRTKFNLRDYIEKLENLYEKIAGKTKL